MHVPLRTMAGAMSLVLVAVGCAGVNGGGAGHAGDTPGETGADDVLSGCEPADDQETTTLVDASGDIPSTATMEEAVGENPDARLMVEQMEDEGYSREAALHDMYAQVVGQQLLADAEQLPGFVTGVYAQPLDGVPFALSFSGAVPDELDPGAYDLDSFGLEVTTGAIGLDHDAMAAAFEAATEVGMETVSGSGDEVTGTALIEVLDATPEQVAAWEDAVDDPSRWCLIRAERRVPCDAEVIADAQERAERQGEVLPNEQGDGEPTPERADEVRRSYLGLTVDASREKAAEESRTVRVVVRDGVPLGQTDDLEPGRLSLTVCDDIVVDTRMDLEPEG